MTVKFGETELPSALTHAQHQTARTADAAAAESLSAGTAALPSD